VWFVLLYVITFLLVPCCDVLYDFCVKTISPQMLWARISIRERCTTLCDKVCQWLATGRWFSLGPPVSSTNKTDHHDITEILLKVALKTIKQTNKHIFGFYSHLSYRSFIYFIHVIVSVYLYGVQYGSHIKRCSRLVTSITVSPTKWAGTVYPYRVPEFTPN
jgi:hypothetical protein